MLPADSFHHGLPTTLAQKRIGETKVLLLVKTQLASANIANS